MTLLPLSFKRILADIACKRPLVVQLALMVRSTKRKTGEFLHLDGAGLHLDRVGHGAAAWEKS